MDTLSNRMAAFKDRMLNLAKGKHSGYNSLETGSNLGQPLVDGHEDDANAVPLGGGDVSRPSPQGAASYYGGFINDPVCLKDALVCVFGFIHGCAEEQHLLYKANTLCPQSYQLRETALLAKEAAAILWEMIALGETGTAKDDMVSQAKQLQAELRGAISDAPEVDESAMTDALESFDMLAQCLSELGLGPPVDDTPAAAAETTTSPVVAPPPSAAAAAAEKPLIEL